MDMAAAMPDEADAARDLAAIAGIAGRKLDAMVEAGEGDGPEARV